MPRIIDCPFCGVSARRSAEHVWAQWMHDTPGARALLEQSHGERIEIPYSSLGKGPDGRYHAIAASSQVAKWLPNVKVSVCQSCNNGWMSDLENTAKRILTPLLFDGARFIRLSADDLSALATWATKSWMAYALIRGPLENPFTSDEYRAVAADPRPLDRSRIWLTSSLDDNAHVSMTIKSSLLTGPGPLPAFHQIPNNWAYGVLCLAGAVLVLELLPSDIPPELRQAMPAPSFMTDSRLAREIWPIQRPQLYPTEPLPVGALQRIVSEADYIFAQFGLPVVGLTDEEVEVVKAEYIDGAQPTSLRLRWDRSTDMPSSDTQSEQS